jgi:hypothetical protein
MGSQIAFEVDLGKEEIQRLDQVLADAIARDTGDAKLALDEVLSLCGRAALEEYLELFLGRRMFTRMKDQNEWRLLLLVRFLYGNRIPSEGTVSELFQLTPSEARGLIRSLRARYRFDIADALQATAKSTLKRMAYDTSDGAYKVNIPDGTLVEHFRYTLEREGGGYSPPEKKDKTTGVWLFSRDAANLLRKRYGLPEFTQANEK